MKNSVLSAALISLLQEKLPKEEKEKLKNEGYGTKNATRKTALAVAIYKKAASGDLSALKELNNIISEKEDSAQSAVVIIDDTGNKDNG